MSNSQTARERKREARREAKRRKIPADYTESVPVKKHYLRRFFYAFSVFFIVFGLIGIVWFVYHQDPNAFGRAEKYYREGLEYQEQGELRKAVASYEKCLEISSSYPDARLQLVVIYAAQGNYEKAETLLDEGLILQPRYEEYYRQKIYLLTRQNRIAEALDYLENISATYIVVKLNAERPAALTSTPLPGTFASGVDVTLSVPENVTVYYTTDGTAPDKNSAIYSPGEQIRVERGSVHLRAVALDERGMVGPEYDVVYRVYNEKTEYAFRDPKMEKLIRLALGKPGGAVYYRELEAVTTLDAAAGTMTGITGSVNLLDDLVELSNLTHLVLDGETEISSFEPLKRLTQLRTLSVNKCGLTDEKLQEISSVIWLHNLSVKNNALTTLAPVASMLSLRSLNAAGNQIKTVPSLNRLSVLSDLNLSGNALTTLSWISGQSSLVRLDLSDNLLTDAAPLASCSALSDLNISSNLFSSVTPLASCLRLETLNISSTDVSTLSPLRTLSDLSNLSAANTKINSVEALSELSRLTTLDVSGTEVQDFTALAGSAVKNLSAASCGLSDLTTMVTMNSLEVLDISGNYLSEISAVALMYQLNVLNVSGNFITDFSPLLNCSKLRSVSCVGLKMSEAVQRQLEEKHVAIIQ